MLKWYINWRKNVKEKKDREQYERGFGFVMTQYFANNCPEYAISDHCYAYHDGIPKPFDDGVMDALKLLPFDYTIEDYTGTSPIILRLRNSTIELLKVSADKHGMRVSSLIESRF